MPCACDEGARCSKLSAKKVILETVGLIHMVNWSSNLHQAGTVKFTVSLDLIRECELNPRLSSPEQMKNFGQFELQFQLYSDLSSRVALSGDLTTAPSIA